MGKMKGSYEPEFPAGTRVRILEAEEVAHQVTRDGKVLHQH